MMTYTPPEARAMFTPVTLQECTGTKSVAGKHTPVYADKGVIFVNAKSYGGTEQTVNGVLQVVDTLSIVTRYREDIKSGGQLVFPDGSVYEIIGRPEDIEQAHAFLKFKCQYVGGSP